jgi:hypothetical protein
VILLQLVTHFYIAEKHRILKTLIFLISFHPDIKLGTNYKQLNLMNSEKAKKSILCHSGETDCVEIDRGSHIAVFVIPGLTRGSTGSPP